MPRERKQKLKKRPDGRYACRYKNQWFYSTDHDDCLRQREEFKEIERRGVLAKYFVRDYAEAWVERTYPNPNIKTLKSVKRHIQILTDEIGNIPVCDVKPSDIKAIYSTHYKTLSNYYIKAAKSYFVALFDSAVADGVIRSNPARDRTAKPHQGKIGGHRSITPQEREWMLTLCKDHRMYPAAMAMLYAGLRPQEAKAFDIGRDVDFQQEIIRVNQTAHTDPENWQKYAFLTQGKTDKSNRTIPLLPPLKDALKGQTGLLITSAHGKPVTRSTWSVAWDAYRHAMETAINGYPHKWYGRTKAHKQILKEGGKLPPWVTFDVTPYDLRHSFCTMCRDMKPPIEMHTVISWMGHSDATMVLKIYDEVGSNRDEAEAQRLRDFLTTDLTTKP